MKAQEHGRRNVRINEEGNTRNRDIERAAGEERCRGHRGHWSNREEIHDHETDGEDDRVDARSDAEGRRDFLSPRDVGRAGREQHQREHREGEGGRVEDVNPFAVSIPSHERLAEESKRDQHELHAEPIVFEPQKQIGAEDDRERAEADDKWLASRPRQQATPTGSGFVNCSRVPRAVQCFFSAAPQTRDPG